jgi:sRNA-binding protein
VKGKGVDDEEQKAEEAKARAEAAKAAIALAKANVEARKSGATPATPSAKTGPFAGSAPKVTASRIVTVTKLKKIAQVTINLPLVTVVALPAPVIP